MSTWRNKKEGDLSYSGYLPAAISDKMSKAQAINNEPTYLFIELAVKERAERIIKKNKKK